LLQGLLVVVKAQHGTRQGLIEASLSNASLQLTEIGSMRQQQHIITNLGDAVAVMSRPQQVQWFQKNTVHPGKHCMVTRHELQLVCILQAHVQQCKSDSPVQKFLISVQEKWEISQIICLQKSLLNQKHVPDMAMMPCAVAEGGQPLVTFMSADTMYLQQEAVLDIASMCSGPEGCSLSVVLQCIAKGGLQVTVMLLLLAAFSAGCMCLTMMEVQDTCLHAFSWKHNWRRSPHTFSLLAPFRKMCNTHKTLLFAMTWLVSQTC
jgi:hypothetical protein